MKEYRLYPLDRSNVISGPGEGFTCEGDDEAIEKIKPMMEGRHVELWQRERLVIRLTPQQRLK
jgi:hypothetical protein